jgi:hypothetical protein
MRIKLAYERNDVTLLDEWLDEMKRQATEFNQELPFISYYQDLASVYTGAMSELVRTI